MERPVENIFGELGCRRKAATSPRNMAVLQGDDDQIVPIADSAQLSIKLLKNGKLKVFEKFPHGMCTTHADVVDPELLAFISGQTHWIQSTAA
jgi:pimeloyl-ACP methyl ester carboxylesterase